MNFITRLFTNEKPLPAGIYHTQAATEDKQPYRIHLRLNSDGSGILVVNAATVLHLNPSAAEYAYHFIKGTAPEEVAKQIAARYRVNKKTALAHYADFADRIHTLVSTPDLDPVSFLDFERAAPHSADLTAPLRLDCALTYRLPRGAKAEDAPTKRVERELTTDEWKAILDKAWQVGIPHITFTGGEPTLREDLLELIAHAEQLGQVSGLLTDGLKLTDKSYLQELLQTGLDHVLVILQPDQQKCWQAIENIAPEDLFITVHFTLTKESAKEARQILQKLADLGVRNLSLSAADPTLVEDMIALQSQAQELGFTMRWDLPVPYSDAHPVAAETEDDKVPSGAGKTWLYVEPDGDVLPAQGAANQILGNFLRDPWEKIHS